ncbi:MAG: hypothetical protein R3B84_24210 [Zavarzinella sp.]
MMHRIALCLCLITLNQSLAQRTPADTAPASNKVPDVIPLTAPSMVVVVLDERLPMSKLAPAVLIDNLCLYKYRVGTTSDKCQAYVDQALGYYYSYVYIEAVRSAETALRHDPDCAYAWLILHNGLERWRKQLATDALKKAQEKMPLAPHREQLIIKAKLQEKGLLEGDKNTTLEAKRNAAIATLNDMLTIYDDDEEAWFARAAIHGGSHGGSKDGVPFHKALLKINPLHPGSNHELVHFYEGSRRPALGWPYAEGYIASSPGLPHAWHMQAHLAMRIGKWDKTTDRSAKAIELQRQYHEVQGVKNTQDHQFSHHMETLMLSLLHDGRYSEAELHRKLCESYNYKFNFPFFRIALGRHQWEEAEKIIGQQQRSDKTMAAYFSALVAVEKGDVDRLKKQVDVLKEAQAKRKSDRRLELRYLEMQGRLACLTNDGDAGLKLLKKAVDKTIADYSHHAWGGGGYYMESWGVGALEAGDAVQAEEAFLEALAHDSGSVRAALGMEVLCQRLGRTEEANRFAALASRLWKNADPLDIQRIREGLSKKAQRITLPSKPATTASSSD